LLAANQAESFVAAVLAAVEPGTYRLERISPARFETAWQLRRQYADKPTISFVDFTSFVVMRELSIQNAFIGDVHFEQVNMGFRILPGRPSA
jgi:predicted nucleic acid-binding protein